MKPGFRAQPRGPARRTAAKLSFIQAEAVLARASKLARCAEDATEVVAQGASLGELEHFRSEAFDLTADSFPVISEPAKLAVASFLHAARAFSHRATAPETRTACAPLLREATRLVSDFLNRARAGAAQSSWGRQFPGEFD